MLPRLRLVRVGVATSDAAFNKLQNNPNLMSII